VGNLFKTRVIEAARALDGRNVQSAIDFLTCVPIDEYDLKKIRLYLKLWGRALKEGKYSATASALASLKTIEEVLDAPDRIWEVLLPMERLERELGAAKSASIVGVSLWQLVLRSDSRFFPKFIELACRGSSAASVFSIWRRFLATRTDYVPNTWTLLSVIRARNLQGHADLYALLLGEVTAWKRGDLADLTEVQLDLIRQAPMERSCAKAQELKVPDHRQIIADYLLGASFVSGEAEIVEEAFLALLQDDATADARRRLMRARVLNAKGKWEQAIAEGEGVAAPTEFRLVATALTANAKTRIGRYPAARRDINEILESSKAPPYLGGRAMLISAMAAHLENGGADPESDGNFEFPVIAGRPLAQSLWVGPRLRWVERLSISSYLRNGWRYQLYVYDVPDNVPDGCEILDAEAILPRSALFRESGASGVHSGSLGAFSDLFRYALLLKRGGMWTDTDVINRRRFEPDGQFFVSTELNDAGIYGPNGALMAAPAGSPFLREALDRARTVIADGSLTFARIGPELIAELIGEGRSEDIRLLPRNFMNPIPWMRVSKLLEPWEEVEMLPEIAAASNIHLYTETWRMIGLRFDAPPLPETFLGKVYADVIGDATVSHSVVAS
jgi:hypothetical protein